MKIFGKGLGEYVAFSKLFLVLIVGVGIVRLALSLAGVPNSTGKWASVTVALLIGVVYYSISVHTSGFGSYKQLLPTLWVLCTTSQVFIAATIALAILTGKDNIFTAPEDSGGGDGKNWTHAGAHLLLGAIIAPLVFWLLGSLILFVTKKVVTTKKDSNAVAQA
jgi:hypothetical protein